MVLTQTWTRWRIRPLASASLHATPPRQNSSLHLGWAARPTHSLPRRTLQQRPHGQHQGQHGHHNVDDKSHGSWWCARWAVRWVLRRLHAH